MERATEAVAKLAAALEKLAHCGRCLQSADYATIAKRAGRSPWPTADDYRLAESAEPLEGDNALNGAWPMILRRTQATLREWQTAWDDATAALKALPSDVAEVLSTAFARPHWQIRLSKVMNDLTAAVGATLPSIIDAPLPRDWSEQIERLENSADELRAMLDAGTIESDSQTEPPANNEPAESLHLTDEDALIINYLREQHPRLRTLPDIEAGATVSRKTVGLRVAKLLANNILSRPQGKNSGVGLTPRGLSLADTCGAQNTR